MPRRIIVILVVSVVFAFGAWGQSPPHDVMHHHPDAVIIDGAKNPELIPDSDAFRLWLLSVSELPNPSEQARVRQSSHLAKIQLADASDLAQLVTVLTEFKSQYTTLVNRYNTSATAALARGEQPNQKLFLQQRDDLVLAARAAISSRLTATGSAQVNFHVKNEKSHMKLAVAKEGVQ